MASGEDGDKDTLHRIITKSFQYRPFVLNLIDEDGADQHLGVSEANFDTSFSSVRVVLKSLENVDLTSRCSNGYFSRR